ncbi:hypothetical protein [Thalassococcus sp. S3]|uniref:hypothetical protein n=1 Tax=Thalassococcus sp. S3 TaxID=2017482 RepID=UPI00102422FE|nr:hypothetical protein [Thalassococcus sp. S3]QBF33294.1 hypothetical protein CFI11_19000 [Thalassococcus sp. S3]
MANTTNALTDFDICVALAQKAIDSQMEYAWRTWKRRSGFDDKISIFKRTNDMGELIDSKFGLEATFAPLKISLAVEGGRQGQVRVTMPMPEGKVTYFNEDKEGVDYHEFKDWSISFIADLDKKTVDLKALAALDPDSHKSAEGLINDSGLPETVFSIEYLFMKLTSVDLLLSDNKDINIPHDVPFDARARALQMLNIMLQGSMGEYMMGTVVRRKTRQGTPTFALTDFTFSVRANWDAVGASTLEYLGALGGRPMPADLNAARLKLNDHWIGAEHIDGRNSSVSGVMILSREVLVEKYLIAAFSKALGFTPIREGLKWKYKFDDVRTTSHDDYGPVLVEDWKFKVGQQDFKTVQRYEIEFEIVPDTHLIKFSGATTGSFKYDGYNELVKLATPEHIEWLYYTGSQQITGEVKLSTSGIAADFQIDTDVTYSVGEYNETENEASALMEVYNVVSEILKELDLVGDSIKGAMSTITQNLATEITAALKQGLDSVAIELKQQGYIPPGGGVFSFQNPRFTNAGDLMMDVIYIAP